MSYSARFAALALLLGASSCAKAPEDQGAASPVTLETAAAPADPAEPAPASGTPDAPSQLPEAPETATLFVRDTLANCQAEAARQCLQIRGSEAEEWRNFYGSIEGLRYEPSYAYELRVAVSNVANPAPDAASIRYKLLEVVSKQKVGP